MTNNELVKKALRRLLPYVLKKAAVHHIDTYLQIASQLKDSADKRSTIDWSIKDALSSREDRSTLNIENLKFFPEVSLESIKGKISCEGLLLN
ncbi:MAG: hypothetical protein ACXVCY_16565, partial [Pseudobdellovibrionaceae bacterium]